MKNYLYLFIISLTIAGVFGTDPAPVDEPKNTCECGVAPTKDLKESETPVFSYLAEKVTIQCPDTGLLCNSSCYEIASKAKEKASDIICALYDHYYHFIASIYYRSCNSSWMYSGVTNPKEFCCQDHKPIKCAGDETKETKN